MDWIQGIQRAINYVEAHITEEIDFEEAAAKAYSSSFHFQRVFGILCGLSLGDYIRMRRLSLAGEGKAAHTDIIAERQTAQNPEYSLKMKRRGVGLCCRFFKINFFGDVRLYIVDGSLNALNPIHAITPCLMISLMLAIRTRLNRRNFGIF